MVGRAEAFTTSISASISKIEGLRSSSDADNIWKLTLEQITILSKYYAQTLEQVNNGYKLAMGFAFIGLGVFILAGILFWKGETSAPTTIIAGTLTEGVSGFAFYLYNKSLPAMAENSKQIDRMQRCLFAYALSEKLQPQNKDAALSEVIKAIATEK